MNSHQAHADIAAMQARLARVQHRVAPPIPTTCCAKGCAGCVWEGYFAALACWLADAQALLERCKPAV